jgi:chromosome segregation ATPase
MRAAGLLALAAAVLPRPASALSAAALFAHGQREAEENGATNPIRKVVRMLQAMQKKVTDEGEKEKDLYEKFMCYCKTGAGSLKMSIVAAETKIPTAQSAIEQMTAEKAQTEQDLKSHQTSRAEAKDEMAKATALREKDHAAYAKESAEYKTNIGALAKAIAAVESGALGTFLQSSAALAIRKLAINGPNMDDVARQDLLAFLSVSGQGGYGYSPKSGEITGILKELKGDMDKSLAEIEADEEAAVKSYDELMAAKSKEVSALTQAIETKSVRVGELGVNLASAKIDLEDTEGALVEDRQYSADLQKDCATKTGEWEERQQTRSQELVALAETIKVLNDDDALELFKKTLPSTGFLQMEVNLNSRKAKALSLVAKARTLWPKRGPAAPAGSAGPERLDLIALALQGKEEGFEKVIKMIDELVALLKKEQVDDDNKKEYCGMQLDLTDDKKKTLSQTIENHESSIADAEEGVATLKTEIEALEDSVKALDKSVADMLEQRKTEHEEYERVMANDAAAKELLVWAKNRLAKFYTPKLYKAPPKRELSEQDSIAVSFGGEAPSTEAPGGIAGTGISVALAQVSSNVHRKKHKDAPPPPPETFGAYKTKSEESGGVVAMMDLLIKDLDKEMTESETIEKETQEEYEKMMHDSAEKRVKDAKAITDKQSTKASMEVMLESHKEGKATAGKELLALEQYISSLHGECDWLLKYYSVRKDARSSEMDALTNAKAVLNGADYSFLQRRLRGAH